MAQLCRRHSVADLLPSNQAPGPPQSTPADQLAHQLPLPCTVYLLNNTKTDFVKPQAASQCTVIIIVVVVTVTVNAIAPTTPTTTTTTTTSGVESKTN